MKRLRYLTLAAAVAVAGTAVLAALPAAQAAVPAPQSSTSAVAPVVTDVAAPLPIDRSNFVELVADSAHRHLLLGVQGPAGSSGVVVTDPRGKVLRTVHTNPVTGLSLSPDGRWVFVVARTRLYRVDAGTFAVTSYPLPAGHCAASVAALDGHRAAFADPCGTGLAIFDTDYPKAPVALPAGYTVGGRLVRRVPGSARLLLADDAYTVTVVTVTASGALSVAAQPQVGCSVLDLAVDPTGKGFVPVCSGPYDFPEYDLNGALVRRYPGAAYPQAAAFSPVGSGFAGGVAGSFPELWEYKKVAKGALLREALATGESASRGMAYSADGTVLYMLTAPTSYSGSLVLHSYPGTVGVPTTDVDVDAPATVPTDVPFHVTGTLRFADGSPAAGRTVRVDAVDATGFAIVTTGPDGRFAADFASSPYPVSQLYVATFAGDATHNAAAKDFTVDVTDGPGGGA